MNSKRESEFSRRNFLQRGAVLTPTIAAGFAAGRLSPTGALAALKQKEQNPYEYQVDAYLKTDPKLLHYQMIAQWPCAGKEPRRLAVDPEGKVYVTSGKTVFVLDPVGQLIRQFDAGDVVRALATEADGTCYVGLKAQVEVFDAQGRKANAWKCSASKTWITGVAVAEQDVFLADAGNRVVLRYDKSGKLLGRIGEKNADKNIPGLTIPSPFMDVEIGRDGLLRVTNTGRHQVEAYTLRGDLEFSWGQPAVGIEGFCGCCNPVSIALMPNGKVVTAEKGLLRIKVYGEKGGLESVVLGAESFPNHSAIAVWQGKTDGSMGGLDVAVDAQGRILVLDQMGKNIKLMTRKT